MDKTINEDEIVEVTSVKELVEMSGAGGGAFQGHAGAKEMNQEEEMKGISSILDSQEELKSKILLLSEKVDKLTLLFTDLQEKYVHQNNQLRQELTGRR